MARALKDILADKFDEPPEIIIIKDYVKQEFDLPVGVEIRQNQIVIAVQSASMASELRLHLHKIKPMLNTDKKLFIRIG